MLSVKTPINPWAVALGLLIASVPMAQACTTDQSDCNGQATFSNNTNAKSCYRLYWQSGDKSFCLMPSEMDAETVQAGDSYCVIHKDEAPPEDCDRIPISTDALNH